LKRDLYVCAKKPIHETNTYVTRGLYICEKRKKKKDLYMSERDPYMGEMRPIHETNTNVKRPIRMRKMTYAYVKNDLSMKPLHI